MKKYLYRLALIAMLGSSLALAQSMPRQQSPPQNPPPVPQTEPPPTAEPPTGDQSNQTAANSANIQSEIQSAFQKEPTLAGANISVQVTDKGVELSGTAPSKAVKDAAEQVAKDHSGGLEVKNNIRVTEQSSTNPGESPKGP